MTSQRYYQLDTLRASLMLLGVVIHAAFIYVTDGTWIVADRDTHRFFDYLVFVIHVFRMPAFFLLSGYLFALLLQRQGCTKTLLRSRVIRLCAPLFLAGLILNVPQLWLFDWFGPEFRGATLASNGCDSTAEWYAGCWVLHLWFLVVLVYFLIVAVLMHGAQTLFVRLYGARIGLKFPGPESVLWPAPVIVLAFAAYAVQSIYWRGGGAVMDWAPLLNVPWFFQYLPFFLAGFVYQRFSKGVEAWNQVSVASAVSLCGTWFILLLWFEQSGLSRRDFIFLSRNTLLLYYAAAFQTVYTNSNCFKVTDAVCQERKRVG